VCQVLFNACYYVSIVYSSNTRIRVAPSPFILPFLNLISRFTSYMNADSAGRPKSSPTSLQWIAHNIMDTRRDAEIRFSRHAKKRNQLLKEMKSATGTCAISGHKPKKRYQSLTHGRIVPRAPSSTSAKPPSSLRIIKMLIVPMLPSSWYTASIGQTPNTEEKDY
jgi:hypothetical protein